MFRALIVLATLTATAQAGAKLWGQCGGVSGLACANSELMGAIAPLGVCCAVVRGKASY